MIVSPRLVPILQFANSVRRHVKVFLTSSLLIFALALIQTFGPTGHTFLYASSYAVIIVAGLFTAFYRAWNDERLASKLSVPAVSAVGTVIAPTYPSVDFILIAENIPGNAVIMHIPHLELSIRNRGNYALKDVRMRPTMYQLDLRFKVLPRVEKLPENKVRIYRGETEFVIKNFARIGKDSVKSRSVAPGTKTKPVDLSTLKAFKFVKPPGPGEPGGPGGPPLQGGPVGESDELRYYALRYSFIDDGTQKRYSFYQVISCQEPYLLPLDNPNMSIIGAGTDDDWLLRPSQLIIDHQRKIYGSYPEEEYPKRQ